MTNFLCHWNRRTSVALRIKFPHTLGLLIVDSLPLLGSTISCTSSQVNDLSLAKTRGSRVKASCSKLTLWRNVCSVFSGGWRVVETLSGEHAPMDESCWILWRLAAIRWGEG